MTGGVIEDEANLSLKQLLAYVHNAAASRRYQLQAAYANLWAAKDLIYKSEVSQVQTCSTEKKCCCPSPTLPHPHFVSFGHLYHASALL